MSIKRFNPTLCRGRAWGVINIARAAQRGLTWALGSQNEWWSRKLGRNMNFVLQSSQRSLLSVSTEELTGLCNALNEVCNGVDIADFEFETRLGVTRTFLVALLAELKVGPQNAASITHTRVSAWADDGSVQAICVTAFGDPADMNVEEAKSLANQLLGAISQAEEACA